MFPPAPPPRDRLYIMQHIHIYIHTYIYVGTALYTIYTNSKAQNVVQNWIEDPLGVGGVYHPGKAHPLNSLERSLQVFTEIRKGKQGRMDQQTPE